MRRTPLPRVGVPHGAPPPVAAAAASRIAATADRAGGPRSATPRDPERNRRSSGSGSRRTCRRGSAGSSIASSRAISIIDAGERRVLNALGEAALLPARAIGQMLDLADAVSFMEELARKLEITACDLVEPGEPVGGEPAYRLRTSLYFARLW